MREPVSLLSPSWLNHTKEPGKETSSSHRELSMHGITFLWRLLVAERWTCLSTIMTTMIKTWPGGSPYELMLTCHLPISTDKHLLVSNCDINKLHVIVTSVILTVPIGSSAVNSTFNLNPHQCKGGMQPPRGFSELHTRVSAAPTKLECNNYFLPILFHAMP